MSIKQTVVGDQNGTGLYHADTVEFAGRLWLVGGGWVPADKEGWMRPVRLIRPIGNEFQNGGAFADYLLNAPIPKGILEASEPIQDGLYEVLEAPELVIEQG